MKFIREIISGKSGAPEPAGRRARHDPDLDDDDALDLNLFAVPDSDRRPRLQSAPVTVELPDPSELRNFDPAPDDDEDFDQDQIVYVAGSARGTPPADDAADTAPSAPDAAPGRAAAAPDVANRPQPAADAPERSAAPARDPAPAGSAGMAHFTRGCRPADLASPAPETPAEVAPAKMAPTKMTPVSAVPAFQSVSDPVNDDDRAESDVQHGGAADDDPGPDAVVQLGTVDPDPFARLDRLAGSDTPAETPSPFQRLRPQTDAAAADPGQPPAPRRAMTRLSDDLRMPAGESFEVPAPAVGRAARRAARVKTRLLGFGGAAADDNPFDDAAPASAAAQSLYPVGWLVVLAGPGRGHSFTLYGGVSQIGRGEDQAVRLDFGDTSISRSNHAAVAYDPVQRKFYLGHGGKANLVRLNGKPVLSTEELETNGLIEIGETRLQFVALCGDGFDWDKNQDDDTGTAVFG